MDMASRLSSIPTASQVADTYTAFLSHLVKLQTRLSNEAKTDSQECRVVQLTVCELTRILYLLKGADLDQLQRKFYEAYIAGLVSSISSYNEHPDPDKLTFVFNFLSDRLYDDPTSVFYKAPLKNVPTSTPENRKFLKPTKFSRKNSTLVYSNALPVHNSFQTLSDSNVSDARISHDPNYADSASEMDDNASESDSDFEKSTKEPSTAQKTKTTNLAKQTLTKTTTEPKPTPFFIKTDPGWRDEITRINSLVGVELKMKRDGLFVKLFPQTVEQFKTIKTHLASSKIGSYCLNLKTERPRAAFIRGLHDDLPVEEVKDSISQLGYGVQRVIQLRKTDPTTKSRVNLPFFVAYLQPTTVMEKFFRENLICGFYVKISAYRNKKAKQCFNCQGYNHSSAGCFLPPRCFKCAGNHKSAECTKPLTTPAKCCNCLGDHPASYQQCPKNPVYQRNLKLQNGLKPKQTAPKYPPGTIMGLFDTDFPPIVTADVFSPPVAPSTSTPQDGQQPGSSVQQPQLSDPVKPSKRLRTQSNKTTPPPPTADALNEPLNKLSKILSIMREIYNFCKIFNLDPSTILQNWDLLNFDASQRSSNQPSQSANAVSRRSRTSKK